MTLVCVGRAVVAGALLISGTIWLGNTTSITELMLNSVALEAPREQRRISSARVYRN